MREESNCSPSLVDSSNDKLEQLKIVTNVVSVPGSLILHEPNIASPKIDQPTLDMPHFNANYQPERVSERPKVVNNQAEETPALLVEAAVAEPAPKTLTRFTFFDTQKCLQKTTPKNQLPQIKKK